MSWALVLLYLLALIGAVAIGEFIYISYRLLRGYH